MLMGKMLSKILSGLLLLAAFLISAASTNTIHAAPPADGPVTRSIAAGGTTLIQPTSIGKEELQWPEFVGAETNEPGPAPYNGSIVNRSQSQHPGNSASATSGKKTKSNPELNLSFEGLNFRQERLARGGNQFSVEPPDQGLCVGNGYVLETINSVLRVFDTAGNSVLGVTDQNSFYGYPPAIDRSTGVRGPFVTDPSCLYDSATQRWFHVVLTLDTLPTGAFTGKNHLDLAVSNTPNPAGNWTIYRIPVQNDGTDGTPNHGCSQGPCLGDYPHIGADANGLYITTNEYSLFGPEYKSANIYAFSKAQLAGNLANVTLVQFDTMGAVNGNPGFTVWPAVSPNNQFDTADNGTEHFLSSNAAAEANGSGASTDLIVWHLTNSASLDSTPALALSHQILTVGLYGIPPKANQKAGEIPLGQCINDTTTTITSLGSAFVGCWKALPGAEPAHDEIEAHLDSNDTRMQQVYFANGKLWGALDTAVTMGAENKAGIAWYIVNPHGNGGGKIVKQSYLALAGNNLTYPAIGVTPSGRGVMAFTVVGDDNYPSAGYAAMDASAGAGEIHIAEAGAGPADGFTGYKAFVGNPPRTRWGDYGAAAVDGDSVWIASEYIAQTCTFAQYIAAAFGSCGGTRASLGNWSTRISQVTP